MEISKKAPNKILNQTKNDVEALFEKKPGGFFATRAITWWRGETEWKKFLNYITSFFDDDYTQNIYKRFFMQLKTDLNCKLEDPNISFDKLRIMLEQIQSISRDDLPDTAKDFLIAEIQKKKASIATSKKANLTLHSINYAFDNKYEFPKFFQYIDKGKSKTFHSLFEYLEAIVIEEMKTLYNNFENNDLQKALLMLQKKIKTLLDIQHVMLSFEEKKKIEDLIGHMIKCINESQSVSWLGDLKPLNLGHNEQFSKSLLEAISTELIGPNMDKSVDRIKIDGLELELSYQFLQDLERVNFSIEADGTRNPINGTKEDKIKIFLTFLGYKEANNTGIQSAKNNEAIETLKNLSFICNQGIGGSYTRVLEGGHPNPLKLNDGREFSFPNKHISSNIVLSRNELGFAVKYEMMPSPPPSLPWSHIVLGNPFDPSRPGLNMQSIDDKGSFFYGEIDLSLKKDGNLRELLNGSWRYLITPKEHF